MLRSIVILLVSISLFSGVSLADTVVMNNGDVIRGKVLNKTFEIKSSYGALTINTDMIKGIFTSSGETGDDLVQTINNDYFSGSLIFGDIEFSTAAGPSFNFKKDDLRNVQFDNSGNTKETGTTLFFMNNGDKFSGSLMNGKVTIRTEYADKTIRSSDLSRIGLERAGPSTATININNGDRFRGEILEKRLLIQPDSMSELSVCVAEIAGIQFNVKKLMTRKFSETSRGIFDFDSDGVSDSRDECPDTECGTVTDDNGCRSLSDADGDGVTDTDDRCAGTPAGVTTDSNGCWVIQAPVFELDKAAIKPEYDTFLDDVAGILERNQALGIEVQGHADNVGSAEHNLKLTRDRAESVVAYLVGKGIARNRMSAVGYGFSRPRASNDTKEGRALNRRVELVPVPESEERD
jgi:outer membrane protein OmpA-like peptidoglycan-associated protein